MEEKYTKFQEWLDECPIEIISYYDYTDTFEIEFAFEKNQEQ
tara:strand:+ start:675 stop:800 length:126 start_codon:yes stop_codon:yes gene_type:complete